MRFTWATAVVICLTPAAASAGSTITLNASGTVSEVFGGPGAYTSDGRIKVGDPFSVSMSVDTSAVISNVTVVNDDRSAVYTLPTVFSYRFGAYTFNSPGDSVYLIINDNHDIGAGLVTDSIAFAGFLPATTDSPFNVGTPTVYPSFQFDAYDVTHSTLNGVGLDQLAAFPAFPSYIAELAFVNSTFDTSAIVHANITSSRISGLTAAVPEPATWGMMLAGFAGLGYVMRRRPPARARIRFS